MIQIIGIYRLVDMKTGRSYIGQSLNIEQRIKEHVYHKDSLIDFEIHRDGLENIMVEILEECSPSELDEREDFYINKFDSINSGYNFIRGGIHNNESSNPKAILNKDIVYEIRESYKNHESKRKVFQKYEGLITEYYFSNLWEGYSWKNVHMDVYTPENLKYYKSETSLGEKVQVLYFQIQK